MVIHFEKLWGTGMIQAIISIVTAISVVLLGKHWKIYLGKEVTTSLSRGIVQIVMAGFFLLLIFRGPGWIGIIILGIMIFIAATIASRRAGNIPDAFPISLYGIAIGSGSVILVMTLARVIDSRLTTLIPIGSMLIANAMNTTSLALERFCSEVRTHSGHIEAGLSLGADPKITVLPYVNAAVRASLIPRIDSIRSLGIVWIPGLMAGMILGGSDPLYAAIYQFVIITLIFAVAGLTSLISVLLIRGSIFSKADQLILR